MFELVSADDIFNKIHLEDFVDILQLLSTVESIDADYLISQWKVNNPDLDIVKDIWYDSLVESPNYSVYDMPIYFNEIFKCWKVYSRRYLLLLKRWLTQDDCPILSQDIKTVIDYGCGLSFSTIGLNSIFPDACVFGTNTSKIQIEFGKLITHNFSNIKILNSNFSNDLGYVDVIFASEFFEHVYNCLEFLEDTIYKYRPKYLIFANTFTQSAIGHFNFYEYKGEKIENVHMSSRFSKLLKQHGYIKVKTKFFNNRPNIYMYNKNAVNVLF